MARIIDVDRLINYLRNTMHVVKTAEVIEKYAKNHATEGIQIGDPLPEGTVIQIYKRDDGRQWARIQRYEELVKDETE